MNTECNFLIKVVKPQHIQPIIFYTNYNRRKDDKSTVTPKSTLHEPLLSTGKREK